MRVWLASIDGWNGVAAVIVATDVEEAGLRLQARLERLGEVAFTLVEIPTTIAEVHLLGD